MQAAAPEQAREAVDNAIGALQARALLAGGQFGVEGQHHAGLGGESRQCLAQGPGGNLVVRLPDLAGGLQRVCQTGGGQADGQGQGPVIALGGRLHVPLDAWVYR
ncbi:hypothetical protein D9M68_948210 [compost metagenome]